MSAETIQADYEQLSQVSGQFALAQDIAAQMLQNIRNHMNDLGGQWVGEGSEAFFNEMEGDILPACERLCRTLEQAAGVTEQISATLQEAEASAAASFTVTAS